MGDEREGPFAQCTVTGLKSFTPCVFAKHQSSKCHVEAVKSLQPSSLEGDDDDGSEDRSVPTAEEFTKMWTALRKNRHMDMTASAGTFPKKGRKLLFCLAEGIRVQQRRFLQGATCITLSQDGCAPKHLARFSAVNGNLETMDGVLGLVHDNGTGHKASPFL